ncbi:4'-phosphopantetheinyl transferase family protein [Chitiniphilus eburneus]|uniref:4'-phosphopantetheinyl transferase superfamily protein n=1 Tax=Chitiniphilus eburneus TaxID=2571148 RepID=A0A4U0Q513_9NEIS|nr:4'-phosphopantetheinyl transferase superfamily protein [Chitiniphilus eburneus]TJZ70734.1 4'-phosphopantetheinyl transferase superfamily protein [Chitiniphilus eburneus]
MHVTPDNNVAPGIWLGHVATLDALVRRAAERAVLPTHELATAARYRTPQSALQFLAGRLLARQALSAVSGCRAGALHFEPDAHGKPTAWLDGAPLPWHFNLSHSHGLVACGVAAQPIGIDLEPHRRALAHHAIAASYFSVPEADWIAAAPARGLRRFTALWTLKEAFLKATGTGLSAPLNEVALSDFRPGHCAASSPATTPERWHCRIASLPQGFWLATCQPQAFARPTVRWVGNQG